MLRPRVVCCSAAESFKQTNKKGNRLGKRLFPGTAAPPPSPLCTDAHMSTSKGGRGLALTAQAGIVAQKLTGMFCFPRQTA